MTGHKKEVQPGLWRLRVSAGKDPVTGKYKYLHKTVKGGPRIADQELARLVATSKQQASANTSVTVERVLDEWMKAPVNRKLAPSTVQGYTNLIKSHIKPAVGSIRAEDLTARHLDELYEKMLDKGLSRSRIRHAHAVMRRALGQAVKWGWLDRNVATLASPPSVPKAKTKSPTPLEVKQILEATAVINEQVAACFALGALTGARRGEILGLRWSDCDLESHVLWFRRSVSYTSLSGVIVKDTKTHQERKVAVGDVTETVIRSQINLLRSMCANGFEIVSDPYLFFALPDGSRTFHPDTLSKIFRKVCDQLGLSYNLHELRHFTASQLVAAGVDIRTVSGRLGHADPSITLRIYSHVLEAQDRQASEHMEKILEH